MEAEEEMGSVPLMVNVTDADILIIGGGAACVRRANALSEQGARVWQIAGSAADAVGQLSSPVVPTSDHGLPVRRLVLSEWSPELFFQMNPLKDALKPDHMPHATVDDKTICATEQLNRYAHFLLPWKMNVDHLSLIDVSWWRQFLFVIPMGDVSSLNIAVANIARESGILVNVATRETQSEFQGAGSIEFMAAVRRDPLTVGIYSGGVPTVSQVIKRRVTAALPETWAEAIAWLRSRRKDLTDFSLSEKERKLIMARLTQLIETADGDLREAQAYWRDIDKERGKTV
ncbi:MAG TPA: hypothetical protein GX717_09865 [Clostridiaceae bacterium]|nr:hypothetical protein [Clostridiaceae bacterium]